MKFTNLVGCICASVLLNSAAQATVYFVSPNGDDSRSGVAATQAWKTLDKINQFALQPGDKVLFESGGLWNGQLKPQGSGSAGKPIIISSYGGEVRPAISIGKAEGAGIRLTNQSGWEISNMEITSGAAPEVGVGRQGIVATVRGGNQHATHKLPASSDRGLLCEPREIVGSSTVQHTGGRSLEKASPYLLGPGRLICQVVQLPSIRRV